MEPRRSAQLRPARRPAEPAALPPRVLARRPARDQLPPVLRHQRPGRAAHGARGRVRGAHTLACFSLLSEGKLTGLRSDHPDGLYDPRPYFIRLQQHYVMAVAAPRPRIGPALRSGRPEHASAGDAAPASAEPETPACAGRFTWWPRRSSPPTSRCREDWAVHGTTGYDFLTVLNGLFVESEPAEAFSTAYDAWLGGGPRLGGPHLPEEADGARRRCSPATSNALANRLDRLARKNRNARAISRSATCGTRCAR